MPLFAGRLLLRDDAPEGWVEVEGGRCLDRGDGEPPRKPDATGWIVPAPVNAHTHVGDAALRGEPDKPRTVAELVGPGGWKQNRLATLPPQELAAGVAGYVGEMAACGVARFLDFREGGVAGAAALKALDLPIPATVLGRPLRNDFQSKEAQELLEVADGIGLSARRDFRHPADVERWAEAAHAAGKPFALHASETVREDLDAILALEPAFVVHATRCTPEDLEDLAQAKTPIAVSPRGNGWFGLRTPLDRMLAAGATVAVGTDNGMLQDGDLWQELGQLAAWFPKVPPEDLLRLATWNGRRLAGLPTEFPPRKGAPLDAVVLPWRPWRAAASAKPGLDVAPQPRPPVPPR